MNLWESVIVAVSSLVGNKMRSFLTMLGVVIGVGAVIVLISIGQGASNQVSSQIRGLGSNLLIVSPGRVEARPGASRGSFGSMNVLTNEDVDAIQKDAPAVQAVAPELSRSFPVKVNADSINTQVFGVTPQYLEVRNFAVAKGYFFTEADLTSLRKVVVLGQSVVDALFPDTDPIGSYLKIGRLRFRVVGVMESKGQSGFTNVDDRVYIPLSTAQKKLMGTKYLRTIYVEARDAQSMQTAFDETSAVLTERLGSTDSFVIRNQEDIVSAAEGATQTMTLLLAGIASISLLVGGIGIMNIMLVSITERTREIGIRKATGARRKDILSQFLVESVVLSVLGGLIGVLLGGAGAIVVSRFGGWVTAIPGQAVLLAFGFSLAVGLFFGMYPANKAARLDPIESLRYE